MADTNKAEKLAAARKKVFYLPSTFNEFAALKDIDVVVLNLHVQHFSWNYCVLITLRHV